MSRLRTTADLRTPPRFDPAGPHRGGQGMDDQQQGMDDSHQREDTHGSTMAAADRQLQPCFRGLFGRAITAALDAWSAEAPSHQVLGL